MTKSTRQLITCLLALTLIGCTHLPSQETRGVRIKTEGNWPQGVWVLVGKSFGHEGNVDVYLFSEAKIVGGSFKLRLAKDEYVTCNFSNFTFGGEVERITVRAPSLMKAISGSDTEYSMQYILKNVEAVDFDGIVK